MSNFAHAHDPFIQRITHAADPLREMNRRVSKYLDVHGRRYGPTWAAYDGKLPSEPGWPRNPVAPAVFNMSVLAREKRIHEAEAARASKKSQGTVGTWVLNAALGRLASTRAAMDERRWEYGETMPEK